MISKTGFFEMISKNVVSIDMLIFSDVWAKYDFFKMISRKYHFPQNVDIFGKTIFSKMISRKQPFPRNVNIIGNMDKKRPFPRNVDIF